MMQISDTNWGIIEERGCMLYYWSGSAIVVSVNFTNEENEIAYFLIKSLNWHNSNN